MVVITKYCMIFVSATRIFLPYALQTTERQTTRYCFFSTGVEGCGLLFYRLSRLEDWKQTVEGSWFAYILFLGPYSMLTANSIASRLSNTNSFHSYFLTNTNAHKHLHVAHVHDQYTPMYIHMSSAQGERGRTELMWDSPVVYNSQQPLWAQSPKFARIEGPVNVWSSTS